MAEALMLHHYPGIRDPFALPIRRFFLLWSRIPDLKGKSAEEYEAERALKRLAKEEAA